MKKVLLLLAVGLFSCSKEIKPNNLLKSTVDFRASYVNERFNEGYTQLTIEVNGLESYSFETYSNPCLHQSFGFSTLTQNESQTIPYIIRTDRDTLEVGVLTFNVSGVKLVKV
jgi:hypothetical protein